jgi:hypothetical protein
LRYKGLLPESMNSDLFRFPLVIFMIWIATLSHVAAQSVRVAVSGDPSLANLVDVTTSELSTLPNLTVLDRADLDKLGQEQELQAVLDSRDYSPIRLLPADGLVLLRAVVQNGKTGVFARLVAVQPGIVLREVALPDGANPLTQAEALEKEFAPYWPKLAALQKGKVTALSLLGLRFEVDAPETRNLERSINVLLASRLGAESDTVVLERWRLNDALFEKTLTPQQPSPFWTGSRLIDGSMRWEKENNRIDVILRLRPSRGPAISIEDGDTADNLPALVERLADKICGGAVPAGVWTPADEARHFAELAKWCLDNGLAQEGAEAIESALALGGNSRTTQMLQVKAYATEAYPDGANGFSRHFVSDIDAYHEEVVAPDALFHRVEAAWMAATLMREYLDENRDGPSPAWDSENPVDLGIPVFYNCLRALRAAYDNGFQKTHGDTLLELRRVIQKLIHQLDARLLPQPNTLLAKRAYLSHRDYYAGLWHDSPEYTIQFYRENLSPKMYKTAIRNNLYRYDTLHPPFLDDDTATDSDQEVQLLHSAPDFCGTPFIVAWDGGRANDVTAIWRKFLDELAASSDPVLQADSLKLELKSTLSDAGRNACVARFVVFIQQHADLLSAPRAKPFVAGIDNFFYWTERQDNADARQKLTALYLSLLQKHVNLPPAWIDAGTRFFYGGDKVTTDEARELLSSLDDYTTWYSSRTPQSTYDQQVLRALAQTRQIFFRAKPELMPATEQANALPVTRFWSSADLATGELGAGSPHSLFVGQGTVTVSENRLWFMTAHPPYQIFSVDPATLEVAATYTIPDEMESLKTGGRMNIQRLDVSPQWLAAGVDDKFFLCSRADNQWRELNVPPFIYTPRFVGQELYLLYRPTYDPRTNRLASEGSGLMHVALPGVTVENVVSSRRVPPQTALDGKPLGTPLDLWISQSGLTLAVNSESPPFQTYATPLGKNSWTLLATAPSVGDVRVTDGGALIGTGKTSGFFAQLRFIGANGNTLLLAYPDFAANYPPEKPLWNLPEDLRLNPPGEIEQISAIMRGEDLVLYNNRRNGMADGKEASLYYFAKGRKDGIKIPLAYDVDTMKSSRPGWVQTPTPVLNFASLQSTDYCVVIYGLGDPGFWVIPWSDIDAYRAKLVPVPASTPPTAAAASANPDE